MIDSGEISLERDSDFLPAELVQDLYARMLLTRVVDDYSRAFHRGENIEYEASCRGHEAAQVGSAVCIEVGKDFTLPYARDLGVMLTIGMTPYEIFRTYIQSCHEQRQADPTTSAAHRWGYQKHNTVADTASVATQILHAAGIAFASKLRKAPVVTIAYCGDDAVNEPDFLEGLTFASQHHLPALFICEQNTSYSHNDTSTLSSSLQSLSLPIGIDHRCIDGCDVIAVHRAMQAAMQHIREGRGPILLEMSVCRIGENEPALQQYDPLWRCQQHLEAQGQWDEAWAAQLHDRVIREVEQAMQDALRDG